MKTALLTASCVVVLLGTVNVNRVCAWYNYDSYMSGRLKTVDVEAIYNLGDEGIPYITKLADHEDFTVAERAKRYLAKAYLRDYFYGATGGGTFTTEHLQTLEKKNDISGFSLPRARAYNSLYGYLEKHPGFREQCKDYLN